ncbi:hypothetical protein COV16_01220 [Candidatus Woesearchaeota archaeon CG10_big_fil_rev_8_21_14_0_10_34_8]|nr:MAG: hypothetical protein COV16_01220 [Candidatus Woesearchaeota archaeon CG10_big_fil_rev_8_21_14_0_10_34_8]
MKRIYLDTNFIMIPAQHKVDIFSEIEKIMHEKYQLYIVERTLKELEFIAQNGKQKEKLQVKLAKSIIKTQNIKIDTSDQETSVDDLLVELSKKGHIVATQDIGLKKRIKENIITLRQKKYLIFK